MVCIIEKNRNKPILYHGANTVSVVRKSYTELNKIENRL